MKVPLSPSSPALTSLLLLISAGFSSSQHIDPDTPLSSRTTISAVDKSTYKLVFSDEFNTPGRSFEDGADPYWTALDKPDDDMSSGGTKSLQFYNSSRASTSGGVLKISTLSSPTTWRSYDSRTGKHQTEVRPFSSGNVNGWNKLCFTGGVVDIRATLPGDSDVGGLWPAAWLLGNLGRPTYQSSTNKVWPWSTSSGCDKSRQRAQELSACNGASHFNLPPGVGRGATEIDILEAMPGTGEELPSTSVRRPYAAHTLQVAPGVAAHRPVAPYPPQVHGSDGLGSDGIPRMPPQTWYEDLGYGSNTTINPFFYGTFLGETGIREPIVRTKDEAYQADAVGAIHQLGEAHFRGMHTYRIEWQPGRGGRLDWFVKDEEVSDRDSWIHIFTVLDESLSSLTGAQIPAEPSYVVLNTAVSTSWGFPPLPSWCPCKTYSCEDADCACALPRGFCDMLKGDGKDKEGGAHFLIDSVRVYQSDDDEAHVGGRHSIGCDTADHPSKEFILGHAERYMRSSPFIDDQPLKDLRVGGGSCTSSADCGGEDRGGLCAPAPSRSFLAPQIKSLVCHCAADGGAGPHCLARTAAGAGEAEQGGAYERDMDTTWFGERIMAPRLPGGLALALGAAGVAFGATFWATLRGRRKGRVVRMGNEGRGEKKPLLWEEEGL